jgi:hypothetical protein
MDYHRYLAKHKILAYWLAHYGHSLSTYPLLDKAPVTAERRARQIESMTLRLDDLETRRYLLRLREEP